MSARAGRRALFGIGLVASVALAAVGLIALASPGPTAAAPSGPRAVPLNGDGAYLWGGYLDTTYGETCPVYLEVGRNGSNGALSTYLYLDVFVWDPTIYPCEDKECPPPDPSSLPPGGCRYLGGSGGEIPNPDFSTVGQTYALHTNANVTEWICDEEGCTEGETIPVPLSVTWKPTRSWEESSSGTYSYRADGLTMRQSGNWSSRSATVEGTVLGGALTTDGDDGGGAAVRSYRQTTICRAPVGSDACSGGK